MKNTTKLLKTLSDTGYVTRTYVNKKFGNTRGTCMIKNLRKHGVDIKEYRDDNIIYGYELLGFNYQLYISPKGYIMSPANNTKNKLRNGTKFAPSNLLNRLIYKIKKWFQ